MYDQDNLYVMARWKDPTPLNNQEGFGGRGFNGDCLQLRVILFPNTSDQTITWWDGWRDKSGKSVVGRGSPNSGPGNDRNILPAMPDAQAQGAKQAFKIDADGKGYTQQITIPWKLLSASGRPLEPVQKQFPELAHVLYSTVHSKEGDIGRWPRNGWFESVIVLPVGRVIRRIEKIIGNSTCC